MLGLSHNHHSVFNSLFESEHDSTLISYQHYLTISILVVNIFKIVQDIYVLLTNMIIYLYHAEPRNHR